MSFCETLRDILRGEINFCSLCLKPFGEQRIHITEEVLIEGENPKLTDVLYSIFGEDLASVSAMRTICNECTVTAVKFYSFLKICKKNSEVLCNTVDSLQELLDSAADEQNSHKTLFVSLNLDMCYSEILYDNVRLTDTAKAYKRFASLMKTTDLSVKKEDETKRVVKERDYPVNRITKEKLNLEGKEEIASTLYDIPSILTIDIILDRNNPLDYRCKICHKKYFCNQKLRQHYFKKHYPRNVTCPKCPQKFFSDQLFEIHFKKYHDAGVCSQCGKHFANKHVLRKHELNHNVQIICQDCGRKYRSQESYKNHITDGTCKQIVKKSSKDGNYQCDVCKKTYCTKPYLAKHLEHEHGTKVGYKCDYCPKRFYTPSRLQTHVVKHTQEKNFVCTICEGRFVTKTSLTYHTRLHTGETPYQCKYCEKAFLSASRRLDHVRRHHLAPSLECEICHVKFKAASSLLNHKRRHFNPNSRLNCNRRPFTNEKRPDKDVKKKFE